MLATASGRIRRLLADKDYDADWLRADLREAGIVPVIPGTRSRKIRSLRGNPGQFTDRADRFLRQSPCNNRKRPMWDTFASNGDSLLGTVRASFSDAVAMHRALLVTVAAIATSVIMAVWAETHMLRLSLMGKSAVEPASGSFKSGSFGWLARTAKSPFWDRAPDHAVAQDPLSCICSVSEVRYGANDNEEMHSVLRAGKKRNALRTIADLAACSGLLPSDKIE